MRTLIALTMLVGGVAIADTSVNFGPSKSCPTYCTGFRTDHARYRLDWLNAMYATTAPRHTLLSVNGLDYSGHTSAVLVSKIGKHRFYQVDGRLQAADGSTLSASYMLQYWTTRVTSGRDAGRIVAHRSIGGGELVFP
jgi:hypothetical protein